MKTSENCVGAARRDLAVLDDRKREILFLPKVKPHEHLFFFKKLHKS
jgi:hypothetical protein